MELQGTVENGVIVPDAGCDLAEGERVEIRKVSETEKSESTLTDRFDWLIGAAPDLPPDFSLEHHHYIRGVPRRNPT